MFFRVLGSGPGRRAPVQHVMHLLSSAHRDPDGPPLAPTVIVGPRSTGRTALVMRVTRKLRAAFPDGQLFADLLGSSANPVAATDVLERFLRDLGVGPERIPADADERGALFRTVLADRRTLIVLDDAANAAQVRPLLPGVGCNVVLVTSRSRLLGLDGALRISLDDAEQHAC